MQKTDHRLTRFRAILKTVSCFVFLIGEGMLSDEVFLYWNGGGIYYVGPYAPESEYAFSALYLPRQWRTYH